MFEYKGLPDTIERDVLERYLLLNGIACLTDVKGDLYVFSGNLGGKQDVYYRPEIFVVSNPHLLESGFTKEVTVLGSNQHDGVLLRNDTEWMGLSPLLARYSYLMAENYLTMRSADIMLRILALITAPNDDDKKAADEFLRKMEVGELAAVAENRFLNGIQMQSPPSNNGSYLTQFIELHQYLVGSLNNEIGLKANYNMKREAIGTGESTMDDDVILPLCENMLMCRREDMAKVNEMYGTNIEVDFSSVWKSKHLLSSIELIQEASQLGSPEPENPAGFTEYSESSESLEPSIEDSQLASDDGQNGSDLGQNGSDSSQMEDDKLEEVIDELQEDIAEFVSGKEIEDADEDEVPDDSDENTEN